MNFPDGIARLRIRCGCDRARVQYHHIRAGRIRYRLIALFAQLPLDRCSIRLRGATSKLFDVKSGHQSSIVAFFI